MILHYFVWFTYSCYVMVYIALLKAEHKVIFKSILIFQKISGAL